MRKSARRPPNRRVLLAAGTLALAGAVLAPVALAPPAPIVPGPSPSRVCLPDAATIITSRGTFDLPASTAL